MAKSRRPAAKAAPAKGAARGRGEARAGGKPIRVRATALGYFNDERKRIGDVFTISSERHAARFPMLDSDGRKHPKAGQVNPKGGMLVHFSDRWMEHIDPSVPERTTTSQEALSRETHRIAIEKSGGHMPEDNGITGQEVL